MNVKRSVLLVLVFTASVFADGPLDMMPGIHFTLLGYVAAAGGLMVAVVVARVGFDIAAAWIKKSIPMASPGAGAGASFDESSVFAPDDWAESADDQVYYGGYYVEYDANEDWMNQQIEQAEKEYAFDSAVADQVIDSSDHPQYEEFKNWEFEENWDGQFSDSDDLARLEKLNANELDSEEQYLWLDTIGRPADIDRYDYHDLDDVDSDSEMDYSEEDRVLALEDKRSYQRTMFADGESELSEY